MAGASSDEVRVVGLARRGWLVGGEVAGGLGDGGGGRGEGVREEEDEHEVVGACVIFRTRNINHLQICYCTHIHKHRWIHFSSSAEAGDGGRSSAGAATSAGHDEVSMKGGKRRQSSQRRSSGSS